MGFFRTLLGFLVAAGLAVFAVFNRSAVDVFWSPVHAPIPLPVYLIALGFMAGGFLLGGVFVWFSGGKTRREKRQQRRQIKKLEKALEGAEERAGVPPPGDDFFPALPSRENALKN